MKEHMVGVKNDQRQEGQLSLAYATGKPSGVGLSWLCLASTSQRSLPLASITVPGCYVFY